MEILRLIIRAPILAAALALICSIQSQTFASFNPFEQPKINLYFGLTQKPALTLWNNKDGKAEKISAGSEFGLVVEIPITPDLASGFNFRISNYAVLPDHVFNGVESERKYSPILSLNVLLKPMIEIPFFVGRLGFYAQGELGPSVKFGLPWFRLKSTDGKLLQPNAVSIGGNVSAALGVEYFPFPWLGGFVEGSYRFALLNNRIEVFDTINNDTGESFFVSYGFSTLNLTFGVKLAI